MCSVLGSDGPQSSQTGGSSLPLVITDESIEWRQVQGCSKVDCVERTQSRLCESSRSEQQSPVEGQ